MIFKKLKNSYNRAVYVSAQAYRDKVLKIAKDEEHLIFTEKCISYNITTPATTTRPKFNNEFGKKAAKLFDDYNKKAKRKEIIEKLNQLKRQKRQLLHDLLSSLSSQDFKELIENISKTMNKTKINLKRKLKNKIDKLLPISISEKDIFPSHWVKNLTSEQFTTAETNLLALGPKFECTPSFLPTHKFIAHIEKSLNSSNFEQNKISEIRSKICNILQKDVKLAKNVTHEMLNAKLKLKERNNIMYTLSDKGNETVIITKSDYLQKIETILQDQSNFELMPKNPFPDL